MHNFFYNSECSPKCDNIHEATRLFSNTLTEFKKLFDDQCLNCQMGLITQDFASNIKLSESLNLFNVVENLADQPLKRFAFSQLKKYPFENYIDIEKDESLLDCDYKISIGDCKYSALYLSFFAKKNGFLFSTALHDDLKQNTLPIVSTNGAADMVIDNLYGETANTAYIKSLMEALNFEQLSLYDRLKVILGKYIFSTAFERDYQNLTNAEQQAIVELFERAKHRNLITPFYPDTHIIKDVSPEKNRCNVYELRVYTPTALRVYFNESHGKIYVANIEKKSNPNQTKDIQKAHNVLNRLILTNK
ncbi:MAG: hypothetical protein B6I17_04515 [Tenericutes bacterium 4572_104]|nr:MAG: hypothetical protein B6I17_04515 [Tenericutes bacterium 4572_104]